MYAHARAIRPDKRIKLTSLLAIDTERRIVLEGHGDTTIGFYAGRISEKKVKEAIRDFVLFELNSKGINAVISIHEILHKSPAQIERLLLRVKSESYASLRRLR